MQVRYASSGVGYFTVPLSLIHISHEQVLKIARLFNVSTDFLLGETNIPDRKNYDIAELGLSSSVENAVALRLEHPEAQIIAGGSDVLVQMREGKRAGAELISIYGRCV